MTTTNIQQALDTINQYLDEAKTDKNSFSKEKAMRASALILRTQIELLDDLDFGAESKHAKNEIKYLEGKKYFQYKEDLEKEKPNIAATALSNLVPQKIVQDEEVRHAKIKLIEAEKKEAKWELYMDILKDAHIYFRGLIKELDSE